jgi:DNA-binding response OmpR family regulator
MLKNQISPQAAPAAARLQRKPNSPRRILVVDAEPLIRRLYTEALAAAGYEVDAAEDGEVAWDALQVIAYDLLITDYVMPKVSGVGLLKKINAAGMTLPVMMATATFPEEVFIRHPELQPDVTLLKPHDVTDFLVAVGKVLYAHNGVSEKSTPPPVCQVRSSSNRLRSR